MEKNGTSERADDGDGFAFVVEGGDEAGGYR